MLRTIFIKIGSNVIKLYKKLTVKENVSEFNQKNNIQNRTLNEIIKNNSLNINTPLSIKYILIIIILSLIPLLINFQMSLEIFAIFMTIILYKKNLPKFKKDNKRKEIMKKFPYALRQMSTQLKAGMGLYDSMKNIANSNYGALSEEFQITLNEIQYGTNYIEAFEGLSGRTRLQSMDKLVSQIIRTLNNGGNLADTLNTLADENSYNMKIKYKEYSEKLNAIMLLYMFIAVLFPVILFIMIIAATTVMGSIIEPELLLILYLFFFPMIISFMILLIKRMEPTLS